jgi:hypothetical protein
MEHDGQHQYKHAMNRQHRDQRQIQTQRKEVSVMQALKQRMKKLIYVGQIAKCIHG